MPIFVTVEMKKTRRYTRVRDKRVRSRINTFRHLRFAMRVFVCKWTVEISVHLGPPSLFARTPRLRRPNILSRMFRKSGVLFLLSRRISRISRISWRIQSKSISRNSWISSVQSKSIVSTINDWFVPTNYLSLSTSRIRLKKNDAFIKLAQRL